MTRPRLEVAEVIRSCHDAFLQQYGANLTSEQRRALNDLTACRTAALGGHVLECPECGHQEIAYNSCGNRHCPKCQATAAARWLETQAADLLDTPYFHVVFTLPSALGPVARCNPRVVYGLLMRAAAKTLLEVAANPKHLGAEVGVLAVLHTWGQNLMLHPHVHCVVTGGGLAPDESRWVAGRDDFFLPVRVLSRVFRGKFLAGLRAAFKRGRLRFPGRLAALARPRQFHRLIAETVRTEWVVYAKPPFQGRAETVLKYLARYTHRAAISNHRLVDLADGQVTFRWKDYAHGGRRATMTLEAVEFVRRFLMHVLPSGFVRVRHYGLLANRHRQEKLARCRELLGMAAPPPADPAATDPDPVTPPAQEATVTPTRVCPRCGAGRMIVIAEFPPITPAQRIGAGLEPSLVLDSS
jgi:ribosomal protein L37AE/L43A